MSARLDDENFSQEKNFKTKIALRGDGEDGEDGIDGKAGEDGVADDIHAKDGQSGSEPEDGEDGEDVTLTLETMEKAAEKMIMIRAITPRKGVIWDETYSMNEMPVVRWSSTGGDGGNGSSGGNGGNGTNGLDGDDAMPPNIAGLDGGPGGNGGKGGSGTNGANGGDGGHVTVQVNEKDTYLLMAVDPCRFRQNLLLGGEGGKPGEHGIGGKAGNGGKGGKSLTILEGEKKKKVIIPGGREGSPGADGVTPPWELRNGEDGRIGSFKIEVLDAKKSYPGIYDISFENLHLEGTSPMANPSDCEFGDIISIRNIKIKNIGQMPIPKNQEIHFCIKDDEHPNVNPLIARKDAFLPAGTKCGEGEVAVSEGELRFFSGFPGEVDDDYDFDPLKQTARLHIQAFQYGPIHIDGKTRKSDFKKEFLNFHSADKGMTYNLSYAIGSEEPLTSKEDGVVINLRYPIENSDGIKALRSLNPGEETLISFNLENVGAEPLGGYRVDNIDSPRRLALRCFYLRSRKYDLPVDSVCFSSHHTDDQEGTEVDLSSSPSLIDVPRIAPGNTHDCKNRLSLGNETPLYSRMALIVDVFIQSLPVPKGINVSMENYDEDSRKPPMSIVQRRKIEFICEPKFEEKDGAKVVLVTSLATTRIQFETWTRFVLTETLNLEYEIFSVSRYGTLSPTSTLENGKTICDVFRNKLIVVLTEKFKENERDEEYISPLRLLPNGCMQQISGYDSSTRWLLVGANDTQIKQQLQLHLAGALKGPPVFPDIASFQKSIQSMVDDRATLGRVEDELPIREYSINVALPPTARDSNIRQKLKKVAESVADFLRNTDPVNQYTVEYLDLDFETEKKGILKRKRTNLIVRQGYCRTLNSATCVFGKRTSEPEQIKSDGMIMSIAEAMAQEMRVSLLADAIRNNRCECVIKACKFAIVSDMIREASVFLESEMKMNEDLELSFTSIGTLLDSVEMLSLLRDCKTWKELKLKVGRELTDLLARLEMVANSKDLRPRFALLGTSQKKATKEAMIEIVDRLRVQWKSVIASNEIEEIKIDLKKQIKEFLQEDTGSKNVNYRARGRWLQGLNYVHSTENDSAFGVANSSKRLIELDLFAQMENCKIPCPSVRVYSSEEMKKIKDELSYGQERCRLIGNSFRLKRQFLVVAPYCSSEI